MATKIVSQVATFESGRDMWEHYKKPMSYNPMENVHLACNTMFNDLRDRKVLGISRSHDDLIIQARHFLMRVQIEDVIVRGIGEHIFNDINRDFDESRALGEIDIELYDIWQGFTKEQHLDVVSKFIGLLDPKTMSWVDPEWDESIRDDAGVWTYKRLQPVLEISPHFAYDHKKFYDEGCFHGIYEAVQEEYNALVPTQVTDICIDQIEPKYRKED